MIQSFMYLKKNKDYLVDYGYANRHGYLAPYRKEFGERTRYHLEPAKKCIIDVMHRYVLLSNIHLEFGKKKWRVLNEFLRYDITVKRSVIFATMGLHNFIHQNNFKDSDFDNIDIEMMLKKHKMLRMMSM